MSQYMAINIDALVPGLGAEHKYLCECIDIIKDNQTNQNKVNEALRSIGGILNRTFGMKVTTTILDSRMDTDFTGINIYPDFVPVRAIVDMACDEESIRSMPEYNTVTEAAKNTWKNIEEWHIDFDAKVFYSYSQRFTPREIIAMMIYEIEKTVYSFDIPYTVFRSIKKMMTSVDYRTLSISKSTLCRNFYMIPFIQACGFVNFKSEINDGSLLSIIPELGKDYLSFLTKITTQFSSSIIDRPSYELKQEIAYILKWVMDSVNDLKYHMYLLKKTLGEQINAEKSFYVKNMLISIYKQFSNYEMSDLTTESYIPNTPKRTQLLEDMKMDAFFKSLQAIGESSEANMLDKSGRVKRITQEEIDVLRLEVEKIECTDDKIYYIEKVHDKLSLVNYALDVLASGVKGKVRDSKDKLLNQKDQLLQIREAILNKKISPERYGLFIKYPAGYEG